MSETTVRLKIWINTEYENHFIEQLDKLLSRCSNDSCEYGYEYIDESETEICCHCGQSVAKGSGLFINRIPSVNDGDVKFPQAEWMCRECDRHETL